MSIPMKLAGTALHLTRTKNHYRSTEWMRHEYLDRSYPQPAQLPQRMRKLCAVEESTVGGFRTLTLRPRAGASRTHLVYLHGGTYINELVRPHWWIIAELIRRTGCTVTVPFYPLAPEHTFEQAFEYLTTVYTGVLESAAADDVVLAGDSAGGGLALGLALHFQNLGLPPPGRLLLFSPWTDITGTNPELPAYERVDPMLAIAGAVEAGSWWAGGKDPRYPLLSPVYAEAPELGLLPPVDIHQGGRDICMPDAAKLAARINEAGGTAAFHAYPGAFHVFAGLPWLPESQAAYDDVERVLRASSGNPR